MLGKRQVRNFTYMYMDDIFKLLLGKKKYPVSGHRSASKSAWSFFLPIGNYVIQVYAGTKFPNIYIKYGG